VALMQSMQSQLERERQRRILEDRRVKEEQRRAEEQERERVKAEKRAAKVRGQFFKTSVGANFFVGAKNRLKNCPQRPE
jgi:hypothetical protein